MKHLRSIVLLVIILSGGLFPLFLRAQKIDSMMNIYAEAYPQEKIYIHFDKKIYNPGETIWFKAYLFTGADPSLVSKNFYAELSDAAGNILQRKIAPVLESTTAGSFDLPQNMKSGHVHFRAYTTWMTNFDSAFYFEKDIRIYSKKTDSAGVGGAPATPGAGTQTGSAIMAGGSTMTGTGPTRRDARIQFFPESGDMVSGLESLVAFKANDQYGLPVAVKGSLLDGSGKPLLVFNTEHDGMGKFLITPDKNDSLVAVWTDEQGVEHRTPLPRVMPTGAVLRVVGGNQKLLFSISRSAEGGPENKHFMIIAHMHQHMVYKAKVNLEENFMSGGTIPTGQLPTGVLELTVFNDDNLPVAERVVFINNHEFEFDPQLNVLGKSVGKRGRNSLQLEVPDTLRSNFSLAVTDAEADGNLPGDDNIISRMLLTGDIRGYVHNPYYYFSNRSDSTASHLDLIMLTHGWRRFKWDQLAKGKTPVIKYPEQNFISMKVEVLGIDPYKINKDESLNVILSKKDSSTQMLSVPHLSGDKFGVTGLLFYDTAKAFYMFNVDHKLSNEAAITFNNGLLRGGKMARPLTMAHDWWTAEDSAFFRRNQQILDEAARVKPFEDKKIKTLETVTVRAREKTDKEKLDEKYTSGMFSGGDAFTFDLNTDPFAGAMVDIFQYLQGKVAGLQITTGSGPGGQPSLQWRGSTPSLYLNEMQVDASQLQSTPVSDIAMVKVFRPGSGVGFGGGGGGVIAVYTKKGGDEKKADPNFKGLDHTLLIGYSTMKQFYTPDYDLQNAPVELEDLRSTLYWKPFVLTDKDSRRVDIKFYNNDISRKIRVVLEGMNEEGKLCRIEKVIQ
jgi:hypothetical protein